MSPSLAPGDGARHPITLHRGERMLVLSKQLAERPAGIHHPLEGPCAGDPGRPEDDEDGTTSSRPRDASERWTSVDGQEPIMIFGRVTRGDGAPVPGAALTLCDLSGDQLDRAAADEGGHYQLVPPT